MVFFLVVALAQGLYGVALLSWGSHRLLLIIGIVGNVLIIVLYLIAHNIGIPFFEPYAGEVQGGGAIDLGAMVAELGVVVALMTKMGAYGGPLGEDRRPYEDNS